MERVASEKSAKKPNTYALSEKVTDATKLLPVTANSSRSNYGNSRQVPRKLLKNNTCVLLSEEHSDTRIKNFHKMFSCNEDKESKTVKQHKGACMKQNRQRNQTPLYKKSVLLLKPCTPQQTETVGRCTLKT